MKLIHAILAAATASALTAGFATAAPPPPARDVPFYDIIYFSDATLMEEVGRNYGTCYGAPGNVWAGASPTTDGTVTAYSMQVQAGICRQDGTIEYM